jgi:hypothetical protein
MPLSAVPIAEGSVAVPCVVQNEPVGLVDAHPVVAPFVSVTV